MNWTRKSILGLAVIVVVTTLAAAQAVPADVRAKFDAKVSELKALSSDPQVVSAVKGYNTNPPADCKAMTNEKWKDLTVLDPFVRSFSKNTLAEYLKTKKDEMIAEAFVSGASGAKVAFLSKPTSWTHKGKPKHEVPMTGKTWVGPVEVDESTGQQQIQVGLPVMDGGTPIGSIVVGLKLAALR
jgi:hypothetical protein